MSEGKIRIREQLKVRVSTKNEGRIFISKHFSIFVRATSGVGMEGGILATSSKASHSGEALINESYLNIYVLQGQDKE